MPSSKPNPAPRRRVRVRVGHPQSCDGAFFIEIRKCHRGTNVEVGNVIQGRLQWVGATHQVDRVGAMSPSVARTRVDRSFIKDQIKSSSTLLTNMAQECPRSTLKQSRLTVAAGTPSGLMQSKVR